MTIRRAHENDIWRAFAAAALLAALALSGCARMGGAFPDPSRSPAEVVRLQVEALGRGEGDAGIEVAFRFASPANKQMTGPLDRFVQIVRAPAYLPMLKHARAEYSEVFVRGDYAAQIVEVETRDGSRHAYLFELSRQETGSHAGCWMTDSVRRLGSEEAEGVRI